jgi:hypothetical protein
MLRVEADMAVVVVVVFPVHIRYTP